MQEPKLDGEAPVFENLEEAPPEYTFIKEAFKDDLDIHFTVRQCGVPMFAVRKVHGEDCPIEETVYLKYIDARLYAFSDIGIISLTYDKGEDRYGHVCELPKEKGTLIFSEVLAKAVALPD